MISEADKRWKKSPKGIASRKKYDRSEVGRAKYKRYRNTKEYKEKARERYHLTDENIRKANIKETNVKNTDYWLSESNRLLSEIKKGLIKLKKEEFFASCPTISIINFTERKFY